jgi:hypothetical protein
MARYESDDDFAPKKPRRKGASDDNPMLQAGMVGGGIFVIVIVVYGLSTLFSSKPLLAPPGPENSPIVTGPVVAAVPAQQNSTNSVRTERERAKPVEQQKDELQKKFGADRIVTVVVKIAAGDSAMADRYLNRKLFRAAYTDYKAASSGEPASDQTKVHALFDSQFVCGQYRQLNSRLPYPQIFPGARAKSSLSYYVVPVVDLDGFANRIGLGGAPIVDPETRTITLEAELPSPIPDPDIDELGLRYGPETVAKIRVNSAKGPADSVRYYLEWQTALAEPSGMLAMTGTKGLSPGNFELSVAPVSDLQAFASRIGYGTVAMIEPKSRTITIDANLPAELPNRPSDVELIEIRRRELDRLQNQPAVEKPRPGEDFFVWAVRSLKGRQVGAMKAALTELKKKDVDETHRREVAETLISTLKGSMHIPDHLDAMAVWKIDGTDRAIAGLIGNPLHRQHSPAIIAALAKIGSKEAARAVSAGFTDETYGEIAARSLIEMGSVGEEFVVKFLDHRDEYMRTRAYEVLSEIGTEKSLQKLRSCIAKEKDPFLKDRVKEVIERIKQRGAEAKPLTDSEAPSVTKPKK